MKKWDLSCHCYDEILTHPKALLKQLLKHKIYFLYSKTVYSLLMTDSNSHSIHFSDPLIGSYKLYIHQQCRKMLETELKKTAKTHWSQHEYKAWAMKTPTFNVTSPWLPHIQEESRQQQKHCSSKLWMRCMYPKS